MRYSLVSLISIAISQSVLMVAFGMLHWTARLSNVVACAVATVPSFYLNRTWTWGRRGTSRLWREVVPFWALAFLGLAFSTWAADFGSTLARQAAVSHQTATMIVMASALLAFGVEPVGRSPGCGGNRRTPAARRRQPTDCHGAGGTDRANGPADLGADDHHTADHHPANDHRTTDDGGHDPTDDGTAEHHRRGRGWGRHDNTAKGRRDILHRRAGRGRLGSTARRGRQRTPQHGNGRSGHRPARPRMAGIASATGPVGDLPTDGAP